MIWELKLYWKTSSRCQNEGSGDEAVLSLLLLLWVLCPDEEDDRQVVKVIYCCTEETPSREVKAHLWTCLPSLSLPLHL